MDKISNTLYATALGDGWGRDYDHTVYHGRLEPRYQEELPAVADILRKWNQT